ncbi:unnamed protein product, partial [Closterium sp. NIES-53]
PPYPTSHSLPFPIPSHPILKNHVLLLPNLLLVPILLHVVALGKWRLRNVAVDHPLPLRELAVSPCRVDRVPHGPIALTGRRGHRLRKIADCARSKVGRIRAVPSPPLDGRHLPRLHHRAVFNGGGQPKTSLQGQVCRQLLLQHKGGTALLAVTIGEGEVVVVLGNVGLQHARAFDVVPEDALLLVGGIQDPANHMQGARQALVPPVLYDEADLLNLRPRQVPRRVLIKDVIHVLGELQHGVVEAPHHPLCRGIRSPHDGERLRHELGEELGRLPPSLDHDVLAESGRALTPCACCPALPFLA